MPGSKADCRRVRSALRNLSQVLSVWLVLGLAGILVTASGQTLYDTSPPAQSGEQVYGSYFDAGIDSIGLYNGNINIRINLITLPGRELTRGVSLSYNSQA